jgi:uncharacterized protein (DUF2132 family)
LEFIVNELVEYFGWEDLGQHIRINCFNSNPSVQSSLKFLRKTPWARKQVEDLYIRMNLSNNGKVQKDNEQEQ